MQMQAAGSACLQHGVLHAQLRHLVLQRRGVAGAGIGQPPLQLRLTVLCRARGHNHGRQIRYATSSLFLSRDSIAGLRS